MCVTFCHRRRVLYFNHRDCAPRDCLYAGQVEGWCETCRWRQGELCGLTRQVLPATGGCCHWNVEVTQESQVVTPDLLVLLDVQPGEDLAAALAWWDVPYREQAGQVLVDPEELALPETYGLGTEQEDDEPFWD